MADPPTWMLSEKAPNVEQLLTLNVHQLYVVDEHPYLIGVISAHDVLRHLHG